VTVGDFADIPLQDPADTVHHGAVFLLRDPSRRDASVVLDGWTTTVAALLNAVVTFGPSPSTSCSQTHREALRAANNGLDYMCVRGWCDAAIRNDSDDCLVWWTDIAGNVVFRARVIFTIPMGDAPVTASVTPAQHDVFRFVRMSRTSQYLFDSYRNMFLALERLLSDIRPRKLKPDGRPAETEKKWITDALQAAGALVPVARLAPPGEVAPIEWFYTHMYGDERSALMHAKPGRYLLPQNDSGRAKLRDSLDVLWTYIRELMDAQLGVKFESQSYMAPAGWDWLTDPMFQGMVLFLSGKRLSVGTYLPSSAEGVVADGSDILQLPTGHPVTEMPWLRTVLGALDATEVKGVGGIRDIGAVAPAPGSAIGFASELHGPTRLGSSVKRFELVAGLRTRNVVAPPHFSA
jgi:hypothetical protein